MSAFGQKPSLESKGLSYLEDAMSREALVCKKLQQYAGMLTDTAAQGLATQLASHHQQNFDSLFQYLNSHQ
ncbi:MAG: hypothetical protein PHD32_09365 [Eubacteriales bacterium]|nr:hypothetical protein [Eubacteriales bacterium]